MQERKLNVHIAFFCYGGNGGIASCSPFLLDWFARTLMWLKNDPRVDVVSQNLYSDTPITMMRNRAVVEAREMNADVLLMIDSDNVPDKYVNERPGGKLFVPSSFDFLYRHWDKGPIVIAAPYCGPPPTELVYIFEWFNRMNFSPNFDGGLQMVSRTDAVKRQGIQEAAALPTGVSMWAMPLFEMFEPKKAGDPGWFEYEWKDKYRAEKVSTEDVFATREASLACSALRGYNPVFCNWDAWAGHVKQQMVGPPVVPAVEDISINLRRAFEAGIHTGERVIMVGEADPTFNLDEHPPLPDWARGEGIQEEGKEPCQSVPCH